MKQAILTLDDSPSKDTDKVVDFLVARGVPALFFVRGAFMEEAESFNKIVRAIERGFVIANHSYHHERTSEIGFAKQGEQILKTEALIDAAYKAASVPRQAKFIRFPHLDRGAGNAHVIDFASVPQRYRAYVQSLFWDGVRLETKEAPDEALLHNKAAMQQFLKQHGFSQLMPGFVKHEWFLNSELNEAVDALITFSTSDWMLTPRHKGQWPYKTLDDLFAKIEADEYLQQENSGHIILAHDDREEGFATLAALIDYFLETDFEFMPIQGG